MRNPIRLAGAILGLALFSASVYVAAGGGESVKVAGHSSQTLPRSAVVNPSAPATQPGTYVFGAPPNGGYAAETAIYRPITTFLSRVTGKHFVYRYSDNWLSYSRDMTGGAYDLVFDSAPLNSWRIKRINHTPLLRLAGQTVYVIVGRAGDSKISRVEALAGRDVCAPQPPDVATLTLMSQFKNPARQPIIKETDTWTKTYKNLVEGKCAGGVLTRKYLEKVDGTLVKVLYRADPLPNPALSAGPRVPPLLQAAIRQALLSPQGRAATAKLRAAHNDEALIPAHGEDYAGLGKMLKNSIYYY